MNTLDKDRFSPIYFNCFKLISCTDNANLKHVAAQCDLQYTCTVLQLLQEFIGVWRWTIYKQMGVYSTATTSSDNREVKVPSATQHKIMAKVSKLLQPQLTYTYLQCMRKLCCVFLFIVSLPTTKSCEKEGRSPSQLLKYVEYILALL